MATPHETQLNLIGMSLTYDSDGGSYLLSIVDTLIGGVNSGFHHVME